MAAPAVQRSIHGLMAFTSGMSSVEQGKTMFQI
jgi:hypothetical protein